MTSKPFVRRTFATLRIAEFGFLGVRVITCRQTPRRYGARSRAGDLDLYFNLLRPLRTSWLMVGIANDPSFMPVYAVSRDLRANGVRMIAKDFSVATSIWPLKRAGLVSVNWPESRSPGAPAPRPAAAPPGASRRLFDENRNPFPPE